MSFSPATVKPDWATARVWLRHATDKTASYEVFESTSFNARLSMTFLAGTTPVSDHRRYDLLAAPGI